MALRDVTTQIRNLMEAGYNSLGERIIGEWGVSMDMNIRTAFRTDDWTWQRRMMDAMIIGLVDFTYVTDRVLLIISFGYNLILLSICSLWDYNPENDDARGDNWNGEIFSWFGNFRVTPCASGKTLGLGLGLDMK